MADGMWGTTLTDMGVYDEILGRDTTLGIKTITGLQVISGIFLGFVAGNVYNKY